MNNILDSIFTPQAEPGGLSATKWSEFQQSIFSAGESSGNNLLVEAVAGSGKTMTILELMNRISTEAIYLAFNKSIAESTSLKLSPGRGLAKTFHSLGYRMWMGNVVATMDFNKLDKIMERWLGKGSSLIKDQGYTIKRLIGLAKGCAMGLSTEITTLDFESLIDSYDLEVPSEMINEVTTVAKRVFDTSIHDLSTFDFDDQLYIPVKLDWKFPSYDTVFVDECQDLSPIQHEILLGLANSGARIIAVGDRYQAIYGFRGALQNSMDLLKSRFQMIELPLSISYRCDSYIIEQARQLCPHITSRPGAGIGQIHWTDKDPETFSTGLVLCRNNSPLFRAILRQVKSQKPCRVLSNFTEGFQKFLSSFRVSSTKDLLSKLDLWYQKEVSRAEELGFRNKLAALADKYETAKVLCEAYSTVGEVIGVVKNLSTGTSGPTFSTVHKAKGLEADEVYILRPDLMPSPYAKSPEALVQERNIKYVAVTRAKHTLVFGEIPR